MIESRTMEIIESRMTKMIESRTMEIKKVGKFPKLMISTKTGMIVLFTDFKRGVVIKRNDGYQGIGYYSSKWVMDYFEDYEGSVVLRNVEDENV